MKTVLQGAIWHYITYKNDGIDIIGEKGSGKTTLLCDLMKFDGLNIAIGSNDKACLSVS